jgi:hypothetical protein
VVIDVAAMRSVQVSGGVATVGAGARLGDLYGKLAQHHRTLPAGCGPSVGIAGLTLGGVLGILGRKHGLTSDHLLAARVVLADGSVVDCDNHHHQELFWALRGAGGGTFGVVTSLVFRTIPVPAATSFHLVWPHTRAAAVVQAWQAWAPAAPDELAASLLLTAPADAGRPSRATVFGAMLGNPADTDQHLQELAARVGTKPASARRRHLPYQQTMSYLAEHGPGDRRPLGHPFSKSEFFQRPLPAEAVTALVVNLAEGRVAGQSRELDFTPWAGAYNRVPADATAFAHRDALFLLKHATVTGPDAPIARRSAARHWLERSWALAHLWGSGGAYPNFPDPDLPDWARACHGLNHDRLVRVKARYDPAGFFSPGNPEKRHRDGAPMTAASDSGGILAFRSCHHRKIHIAHVGSPHRLPATHPRGMKAHLRSADALSPGRKRTQEKQCVT